MDLRRTWRATVLAALAAVCLVPAAALAFPESTETQGEIPIDLNGVWLVVHHLAVNPPGPTPTPGAEPTPAETAAPKAQAEQRTFNVVNLFKILYLPKAEAQKVRDAKAKRQQASIDKANAVIASMHSETVPMQTEDGQVEGGPRVIVPVVPHPPGYDPKIHEGDWVDVFMLDVDLPKSIDDAFQAAQRAEKPFVPTDKQLALLRSSWSKLAPKANGEFSRIEWKVIAKQYFDQGMQYDPNLLGAQFVISATEQMIPRAGQPDRNIVVYGFSDLDNKKVLGGGHARAMMATAPFPIPIEFHGTFKMYKVADLSPPTVESLLVKRHGAAKGAAKKEGSAPAATTEAKEPKHAAKAGAESKGKADAAPPKAAE
jgi:hypothetical protein